MVQRLKDSVRQKIEDAAADAFVRNGYRGTRLQDVAQAAGISTGNLYRYYKDKDALFDTIVSRTVAARLLYLLRSRVKEFGAASNWPAMTASGSTRAAKLLAFFVEERVPVLILLAGAEDSPLAHIKPLVIREMTRLATAYLQNSYVEPEIVVPQAVLVQIFVNTVDMIVAILRNYHDAASIQMAFSAFWRYQLAGLQALLTPKKP